MDIDEVDISKIAEGQSVQITADAVPDQSYTAIITKVSVLGTTNGGVTSYPVTVRIDETEGFRPGMNVDAKIVLGSVFSKSHRKTSPGFWTGAGQGPADLTLGGGKVDPVHRFRLAGSIAGNDPRCDGGVAVVVTGEVPPIVKLLQLHAVA